MAAVPFHERSHLCDSRREELANVITHAAGIGASIVGLVFMILVSGSDPWRLVAGSIFGATLVLLYSSSTLYHSFSQPRLKSFFQVIDHSAIYLLIAGTYTPLTLVSLRGPWGWSLFGLVWFLAIGGILTKALMRGNREHWLSTAVYVVMGWLALIAIGPILRSIPTGGIVLIAAGGVCYTGGVAFFAWKSLRYSHALWHLCVLAGSACHVLTVILYILQ
ncbi:MAG: hemolysin III family protein [Akkermansiaceae bacterium]|nr:hemolysin III family protein [Akkermansiaceae bacterium]NNM29275.1 hemolysin III family protein [Akkermansiaceae bacterium]